MKTFYEDILVEVGWSRFARKKMRPLSQRATSLPPISGTDFLLLGGRRRFQNRGIPLVGSDHAVELSQLVHFADRNAQLLDFHAARVVQHLPARFGLAVVAAKAELHIGRRRQLVDFIARWQRNIESVGIPRRPVEFERKL